MDLTRPVEVGLHVNAKINDSAFQLSGTSQGTPGGGIVRASASAQGVPKRFHLSLLSHVLLTGQPFMSRTTKGAVNPFLDAGGLYEATRTLNLGTHGELVTAYRVEQSAKGLRAVFETSGNVDVPVLKSIAPTIETWIPERPGRISGHFTMVWSAEDGSSIKGEAETQYVIPSKANLPEVHYRAIQIDVTSSGTTLKQDERIIIFTRSLLFETLAH